MFRQSPPTAQLTEELLIACETAVQYRFRDRSLLALALTHASIARTRLESNERLEFLGDAILGAVVCEQLYELYPESPEGELTRIKSVVVSRATCARMSRTLGLHQFLLLGKGVVSQDRIQGSILAAVFEALVGAVYLDGGFDAAKQFVIREVEQEIVRAADSATGVNYKSLLQQLAQRSTGQTPVYAVVDEKGPDHSKCFQVAAVIGARTFASAWGPSKKEAEQRAARVTARAGQSARRSAVRRSMET
jgi:ribonuclease III